MWILTKLFLSFLKLIAPLYYLGKRKINGLAKIRFAKDVVFLTRPDTTDAIALYEIWKNKCYKEAQISKGDIVVDIGAHIGGYTVLAAKLGARVIAYEAAPGNYELLVRNLSLNGCNNIKAYNSAVSSDSGEIMLNIDTKGSTLHSIHNDSSFSRKIKVPAIDLHQVFVRNKLKRIDILKIDTEGSEYAIVLHTHADDLRKIGKIILEYHDYFNHGHNKSELKALLKNNGFNVTELTSWYQRPFRLGVIFATRL